jgi:hypothetical protein
MTASCLRYLITLALRQGGGVGGEGGFEEVGGRVWGRCWASRQPRRTATRVGPAAVRQPNQPPVVLPVALDGHTDLRAVPAVQVGQLLALVHVGLVPAQQAREGGGQARPALGGHRGQQRLQARDDAAGRVPQPGQRLRRRQPGNSSPGSPAARQQALAGAAPSRMLAPAAQPADVGSERFAGNATRTPFPHTHHHRRRR